MVFSWINEAVYNLTGQWLDPPVLREWPAAPQRLRADSGGHGARTVGAPLARLAPALNAARGHASPPPTIFLRVGQWVQVSSSNWACSGPAK